jgi:hypothetical protein
MDHAVKRSWITSPALCHQKEQNMITFGLVFAGIG